MPDYKNTKIYKIYSPSNKDLVYIGHTTKQYLSQRLAKHVNQYHYWLNNQETQGRTTSYSIFEQCNDYQIILVENYPCNDVNEARSRERYYIENNECINKNIPGRTNVERCATRYANKKEIISDSNKQKIQCECGATVRKVDITRHRRSQKHLSFIAQLK